MSAEELKVLSVELAKEAYPSAFGLPSPIDQSLIEKDPRHTLLKDNFSFIINSCDDFLVKSSNTGVGVRKYPVLKFKEFVTSTIDSSLPTLDEHISSTISLSKCANDDDGVVMVRKLIDDINTEGGKIISEALRSVKGKKHRQKFDGDLKAWNNMCAVFTERAGRLVEDVNELKSNAIVRKGDE